MVAGLLNDPNQRKGSPKRRGVGPLEEILYTLLFLVISPDSWFPIYVFKRILYINTFYTKKKNLRASLITSYLLGQRSQTEVREHIGVRKGIGGYI